MGQVRRKSGVEVCTTGLVKEGKLSAKQAKELRERMERYALNHQGFGPHDVAMVRALDEELQRFGEYKRRVQIQAVKEKQVLDAVASAKDVHGKVDAGENAAAVIAPSQRQSSLPSVFERGNAIRAEWHGRITEALSRLKTKRLGFKSDQALAKDIVREMHGTDTGNADAHRFAKQMSDLLEEAKERFNRAGGSIKTRQDFGTPHFHDVQRMLDAGKNKWVNDILPLLDPARMYDEEGLPINPDDLPEMLSRIYDQTTTGGIVAPAHVGAVGGRHLDHRFLAFEDGSAWVKYSEMYGPDDQWGALMGHVSRIADETAQMEILGPNPRATVDKLAQVAGEHAVRSGKLPVRQRAARAVGLPVAPGKSKANYIKNLWNTVSHEDAIPGNITVAGMSGLTRTFLMGVQLGSATISAISDAWTHTMTARWDGMSAVSSLGNMLKLIGNDERKQFAVRLGLGAEGFLGQFHGASRFDHDVFNGPGRVRQVSEAVIRASGLNAWTDNGRWAFGMEMMGHLATMGNRTLGELKNGSRKERLTAEMLERYGIRAQDWDQIRKAQRLGYEGAEYIATENVAKLAGLTGDQRQALVGKLLSVVHGEMDLAVPTASPRARAMLTRGTQAGTAGGELWRLGTMYKTFPLTMVLGHMARGWNQTSNTRRAAYLGQLFVGTTIFGAAAVQGKLIAKGKEPMTMDPTTEEGRNFWAMAMMQGGGLGIFGDFVQAGVSGRNRYGNSFLATLAGPVGGLVEDARNAAFSPLDLTQAGGGEAFVQGNVDKALRYTPGSSLWYTRAAFDRIIGNTIREITHGAAENQRRARRKEQYYRREAGGGYWWRPGQKLPEALR